MQYILIAVLIIVILVFIFTSGAISELKSISKIFSKSLFSTSTIFIPPAYYGFYSSKSTTSIGEGFSEKNLSPYFGKFKIERVVINSQFSNYEEIIIANLGISSNEKIDITGWSIFSNKNSFVITDGVADLNFKKVFQKTNIVLNGGQKAKIYSTYSPLGIDFQLNKCSGYLNSYYSFTPKLDENCPKPTKKEISYLDGKCQDYILKLNQCEIPKNSLSQEATCLNYLKNLNYQGCYDKYKKDSDFYGGGWLIFMGRKILDPLHDRVRLYDRNGLLIDEYIY